MFVSRHTLFFSVKLRISLVFKFCLFPYKISIWYINKTNVSPVLVKMSVVYGYEFDFFFFNINFYWWLNCNTCSVSFARSLCLFINKKKFCTVCKWTAWKDSDGLRSLFLRFWISSELVGYMKMKNFFRIYWSENLAWISNFR